MSEPTTPARPALLISTDGDVSVIDLPAEGSLLPTMYRAIGCHGVDVVRLAPALDMWIDDDGMYTQPVNQLATLLAKGFGFNWQDYHGPALLTGGADAEGDTLPLSSDALESAQRILTNMREIFAPLFTA